MFNVLVLGCGRSGTSMIAGMIARAGYYIGADYIAPRPSNPKGFFEGQEVNAINEELLRPMTDLRRPAHRHESREGYRRAWRTGQRWLAVLPATVSVHGTRKSEKAIARLTRNAPFCFKDPRFAYTLPAWRPFIGDARFVCVFRHPGRTATSITTEIANEFYLRNLDYSLDDAFACWDAIYGRILDEHANIGDWLFIEYEELLSGRGLDSLADFCSADIDRGFPDAAMDRSRFDGTLPPHIAETYDRLRVRAKAVSSKKC